MPAVEIRPGIYWIGVNDRTTDLFEGVWPISQEGVSYNSYVVLDEKKALIDLAHGHHASSFIEQLYDVVDPHELDYVILNHMEPDHTGVFNLLRDLAPQAVFVLTRKAKTMLDAFYGPAEHVHIVEDGEEIVLGTKRLQFYAVPFVHWPETMVTFESTQHVLFSCDAFGGYGALRGAIFDDQCDDMDFYLRESLRYYVNIVSRFSGPVLRAIEKLGGLEIEIIAPSHGLIWRRDPGRIVALYKQWASYATQPGETGVTLLYGSMYGNTERVMNAVASGIAQENVPLEIYDVARTHASYILPSLWVYRGVMIGAPTYEVSLFPPMAQTLQIVAHKRILNKRAAYFGSKGWSGGAYRDAQEITAKLKWEWVDTLEFLGGPTRELLHRAEGFGRKFAAALKQMQTKD